MVIMKRKISDLKVAELKVELEKRGLESKGLKGVLVQRLQKAVEEDGMNENEIDLSGVNETASPKTSRRSVGRQKRTTENESEQVDEISQEEEKENVQDAQPVEETERTQEPNDIVIESEESSIEEVSEQNDTIDQTDDVEDEVVVDPVQDEYYGGATPTRDEEGDVPATPFSEYGDENVPPEADEEMVVSEEVPVMEGYTEEAGNDFREEDSIEYPEEIDQEDVQEEMDAIEEAELLEEEEGGEVAENVESETFVSADEDQEVVGDDQEVVGDDQEVMGDDQEGVGDVEVPMEAEEIMPEQAENTEQTEKVVVENDILPTTEIAAIITAEEKPESIEKEEVVAAAEVDVLDMLDYDLEITGDQNNISTPSEDRIAKTSECESTTMPEGKMDSIEKTNQTEDKSSTLSQDRKTRQSSDSTKKPSSSSDQSKSGGQSSTKSSTSTSKDGSKSTSGSKRESAGSSSSASKKEDANKNLWISGLSQTTRASELKSAFSRYGKVIGAKVVTNIKSPGSRCYGYVTMSTVEAASKCILHLNNTEMHGRMITVEIAKSDPSASSKKPSTSSSSVKKELSDSKTTSTSKSKDSDSKSSSTFSRRQSSSNAQSTGKDTSGDMGKSESDKKSASDMKNKDNGFSNRKGDDTNKTGRSKSPIRDRLRAERISTSGPRSGDKRRSPPRNRSASTRIGNNTGYNKDEPERKRARQPDADRKVVMDSHKGELRVNVSRTAGRTTARWQGGNEPKPKPLLSLRRSTSPLRRRSFSPLRGSVLSRTGGARGRGGRGGRGGFVSRQSATYEDRSGSRNGNRTRSGPILTFNQIRAQQRERERNRGGGRGGLARGELQADRERLRREREERDRLRIERERLEKERRQLEKDRQERTRLEAERIRLEQERKRELERIEREKAEMRRLQEITRYEVEQRQRAIKRTYDDDSTSHRSSRTSNRDTFDSKRSLVSDRDVRTDARRGSDRDERRGYDSYNTRDTSSRNGPPQPSPPGTTNYRSNQGSYRGSVAANERTKSNTSSYDNRRTQVNHHDADTRYSNVTGGTSAGRSVEKYERGGRAVEYSHSYDRDTTDSPAVRRRGVPQPSATREATGRDGRKVIRERPGEHRSAPSPEYRRPAGRSSTGARVEITREQSPPVRRTRRDSSPVPTRTLSTSRTTGNTRGTSWRDSTKAARDTTTSRRGVDDRDLREQIRGGRQESYTESNRERGNQRNRGGGSHSPSPPVRSGSQYQGRWPESATDATSQPIYSVTNEASAIPTQTGRSGGSAAWGHVQQWQQSTQQNARAWPSAMSDAASAVTRQMLATAGYGTVQAAPTALIAPPGTTTIPASQGYIPSSDRQSRPFQTNYKQIQRRY